MPSTLFAVLRNAYATIDHYWLQDVSTAAQAAIGSAVFVLIVFAGLFALLAAGAAPIIARAVGARDDAGVRRCLGAALSGVGVLTVVIMLVGGLGAEMLAAALGLEGDAAVACASYLRTLSLTSLPLVLSPLIDQSFIAMGSARAPLILHIVILGLNLVLTPLLVHTAGLGITGAALASNGAHLVGVGIGLWILWRRVGLRWPDVRPTEELARVVRVGAPIAVSIASYALVYWAMLYTSISPLGPHVNAALGIGFSVLEGFAWPCFNGVALAVSSFVGRALGEGAPDKAQDVIRKALPLTTGLGVIAALVFFFGADTLTGLLTRDPQVHAAAIDYAQVLAASQLFVAWDTLSDGVLSGAGDTRTVFWLSTPLNLVRIPLAWLLAFPLGWGAIGVWWAINLTTYVKATLKTWAVWRGGWKRLEI